MTHLITTLIAEHKNLGKLLDIIETEITAFDAGDKPDYELVQEVLDYLLTYPDMVHHPKEDAMMRRLNEVDPDAQFTIGDLEREHANLGAAIRRFKAAVANVLHDETLPRDWFSQLAREFVAFQKKHMHMEEVVFFPDVIRAFSDTDWDAAQAAIPSGAADRVFGETDDDGAYPLLMERLRTARSF